VASSKLKGRGRAVALEQGLTYWAVQLAESGIVKIPLADIRGRTFRLEDRVQAPDKMTALAYPMCLLWDPERKLGEALSQCTLGSCGKFFFVEQQRGPGRRRRGYCSDEHGGQTYRGGNTA